LYIFGDVDNICELLLVAVTTIRCDDVRCYVWYCV